MNRIRAFLYTSSMASQVASAREAGTRKIELAQHTEHGSDASVHMDAFRGLAALAVFLGHGRGIFLKSGLRDMLSQTPNSAVATTTATVAAVPDANAGGEHETIGHEAVIVFFVLSGYFVGGSALRAMRKGVFSWKTYLFQRITRLWIVLLPALLLGWALDFGGMHLLPGVGTNIYSGPVGQEEVAAGLADRLTPAVFLGNLFFVQGVVTRTFGTNVSLWSLSYEFWYYIFFPFLVVVFLPSKRWPERVFSGLLLVALFAIFGMEISRYFVVWLFGVGVALLPLKLAPERRKLVTAAAGLVFVLTLGVMLKARLNLYLSDIVLSFVFSALLWTILHATGSTVSAFYRTQAQALSNMSYTLYLVHMPFFALVSAVLTPVWQPWAPSLRSAGMMLGVFAVVFAASWLMYFAFERNTDRIRKMLPILAS